jgi:hypothetical protein
MYNEDKEFTGQARGGLAVYLLLTRGQMRTSEMMEALGYRSTVAVLHLMNNLSSAHVPVYQPTLGAWDILKDQEQDGG